MRTSKSESSGRARASHLASQTLGFLLLTVLLLGGHRAYCQGRSGELKREARTSSGWVGPDACARDPVCFDHAERAREASRQGQLEDALKEYQAAFGLQPMPRLVFNIARIQQKLGQLAEATTAYELYLNLGAEGDKEMAAKARSYLDEIYVITEPMPGPWTPPKAPPPPPLYKRPWFWGIVLVTVGTTVTGLTIGLLPKPSNPTDIVIYRPFDPIK
jgi:hypothetical protein